LVFDGPLPDRYNLRETESAGYRQRPKLNVLDSDATLIINTGTLDGGTALTLKLCQAAGKPHLVCQLDSGDVAISLATQWLEEIRPVVLNVAGPREEKRPSVYEQTFAALCALLHRSV